MGKWALVFGVVLLAAACWWLLLPGGPVTESDPAPLASLSDDAPSGVALPPIDEAPAEPVALDAPGALEATVDEALAGAERDGLESLFATGRVIDETGRPLAGAEVLLLPDWRTQHALDLHFVYEIDFNPIVALEAASLERTRTDARGDFQLEGLWRGFESGDGVYHRFAFPSLLVRARGFALHGFPLDGYVGGAVDAGELVLSAPGGSLRARLVDEQGAPLDGVNVVVEHRAPGLVQPDRFPQQRAPFFHARSDVEGVWRITHQWLGEYRLSFLAEGRETLVVDAELAAGEDLDLGTLTLQLAGGLSGTVRDVAGEPVADARVTAADRDFGAMLPDAAESDADFLLSVFPFQLREGVRTDELGRFALTGLPRDKAPFRVIATARGHEVSWIGGVAADAEGVELVLRPEARITVEALAAETGAEIEEFELLAFRDINRWLPLTFPSLKQFSLIPVSGHVVHLAGPIGTRLLLSAPGFTQELVDVAGLQPGDVHIERVAMRPAHLLEILVVDDRGEPIPDARLSLAPPATWGSGFFHELPRPFRKASTDAAGLARFEGLAAGLWTLDLSAEAHRPHRDGSFEITEADARHELTLERSASLSGRVVRADGTPATGQRVVWHDGKRVVVDSLTDAEGRFRIRYASGLGSLHVQRVPPLDLELGTGESHDLELHQRPPGLVTGRVFDEAGGPLPERLVQLVGPAQLGSGFSFDNHTTGLDGRFRFECELEGDYELLIVHEEVSQSITLRVVLGGALEHDFRMGGASIAGVVITTGIDLDPGQLTVKLEQAGRAVGRLRPEPDGSFSFGGLTAGRYELETYGGLSITQRWGILELEAQQRLTGVELRPQKGARLFGQVVHEDGGPFQGFVHLRSSDGEHYELAWPRFGDGSFDLRGLPPGDWQLDLAKESAKTLGPGADAVGEPGAELPFYLREFITLASGERREVRLVVPDGVGR